MTKPLHEWFWVSCNGPAVGLGLPWPSAEPPGTYPTPEQWLGFPTYQEARDTLRMLLKAPLADVTRYMTVTFPERLGRGEVAYRRPENPQPPTLEE
jgi:hypothetical protein